MASDTSNHLATDSYVVESISEVNEVPRQGPHTHSTLTPSPLRLVDTIAFVKPKPFSPHSYLVRLSKTILGGATPTSSHVTISHNVSAATIKLPAYATPSNPPALVPVDMARHKCRREYLDRPEEIIRILWEIRHEDWQKWDREESGRAAEAQDKPASPSYCDQTTTKREDIEYLDEFLVMCPRTGCLTQLHDDHAFARDAMFYHIPLTTLHRGLYLYYVRNIPSGKSEHNSCSEQTEEEIDWTQRKFDALEDELEGQQGYPLDRQIYEDTPEFLENTRIWRASKNPCNPEGLAEQAVLVAEAKKIAALSKQFKDTPGETRSEDQVQNENIVNPKLMESYLETSSMQLDITTERSQSRASFHD